MLAVILFSLVITLFSAGIMVYIDYLGQIHEINTDMKNIETALLPNIVESLWVMDKEQLQSELNGILNIAHMKYVKIQSENDIIASAGIPQDKYTSNHEFPMYHFHNGRRISLGTLYISVSMKGVYDDLRRHTLGRLLYLGAYIFLISLFLFFIFQVRVTGHLTTIADYFKTSEPWKSEKPLTLAGRGAVDEDMDEIGQVVTAINTMSTKIRKTLETLSEEKERLAVTLRSIGDGVITTDIEGRIVSINKAAESLTGWTPEEAAGKPLDQVFHIINEQSRARCENPVEKAIQTGMIVELANHTVLISRDGIERTIADSGAPILDKESKTIGVVLVFRDITEKEKIRKEVSKMQKLESLAILAGGIAHDFNNLLTAILGNISLAKMLAQPGDQISEKLIMAEKASVRAKDLTQQLLTFSKGGAPIKKTTSITELIKDSAGFVLSGSHVSCKFEIADDLWPVEVDEGQISQVISNLVINAAQAMPDGGTINVSCKNIAVGVDTSVNLKKGKYIQLLIKDQGIGIQKEYLEKIFDPFYTTKEQGRGLGLATVFSIIKNHEGHIAAESEPGVGTTFTVYLPALESQRISQRADNIPVQGKGKVLVMDDEEMVRNVAEGMLKMLGYQVEVAVDGAETIELYKKALESAEPFNVVIMDLTIAGGMGGKEAIKKLSEIDPGVVAIVSSGFSTDPIMADFRKYGFSGIITKPYKIQEMSEALYTVIKPK
jgi:PAS domain S-box-containing protein